MFDALAPAAYRPGIACPDSVSTRPSASVRRPPSVKPAYIALPRVRSNAPQGPVPCAARYFGCLWKSGSSPLTAYSL
ncbi:Uncharacterised protein [Mycobacteroides abscessus subsp. abscessus]|nr:Uncharacterised protein [Mycobacteroides abscessus subsp. abscessus]